MIARPLPPVLQTPPGSAGHGGAVTAGSGRDSSTMQEGSRLQPKREHAPLSCRPNLTAAKNRPLRRPLHSRSRIRCGIVGRAKGLIISRVGLYPVAVTRFIINANG